MNKRVKKQPDPENKGVKRAVLLAIASAFAVFGLTIFIALAALNGCDREYKIPDLVGMNYDAAVEKYGDDFTITIERNVESDEYPSGYIVEQDPAAGRTTKSKKEIKVAISKDTEGFVMGDYQGEQLAFLKGSLQEEIKDYDIELDIVEEESDDLEKGTIIKTIPAKNSIVKKGDRITVYVSLGKAVTMPDLVGLTLGEAKDELKQANLELGGVTPRNASDDYIVEWQSEEAYEDVVEGTEINLRLKDNSGSNGNHTNDGGENSGNSSSEGNGSTSGDSNDSNATNNLPTSETGL